MQTEFETDTKTLRRIADMLLALAVLADHAGFALGPVRWFVLFLLRPAAAAGQAIVADVTRLPDSAADCDALRRTDGMTEAMRLAHDFRVLAAALYEYLCWIAWRENQWSNDDRAYNATIRSVGSASGHVCAILALTPPRWWRLLIDDS